MTEVETLRTIERKTTETLLLPIDKKIINSFFKQKDLEDVQPFNYPDVLSKNIDIIEDHNPDLFEEIFINSEYFKNQYLRKPLQRNFFMTGSYIMYEIFSRQAKERNIEMPIFELVDFKSLPKIKPNSNTKYTNLENYLFLGNVDKKTPPYIRAKRKGLMNNVTLFTNEQPEIFQKLNLPDNPSMFVGASFVYGNFRKKIIVQ